MWNNGEGYYSKFKYVEFARFLEIDGQKLLARYMLDKVNKIPQLINVSEIDTWRNKNQNTGVYVSVFRYSNSAFVANSVQIANLYFDLDDVDPSVSLADTRKVVKRLSLAMPERAIRIYFTGKKGFHIECECVTLGITPGKNLAEIYRYIAHDFVKELDLTSVDFAVYDPRRIWRLPNSKHQETGLFKVPLTLNELNDWDLNKIKEVAAQPRDIGVPDQAFDMKANQWYRDYVYKFEESKLAKKITPQSIIERFQTHGASHFTEFEKEFDPEGLFKNCPAVLELWAKAETKHHLEHEERLFLCSLLSYTDEAIEYLHAIFANCDDYNFEKSQAHIDDWVRRRQMGIGGNPYSCERASSAGIGCTGCVKLEPKPKYERIGDKLYPTNEYAAASPIRFCYSKKT